MASLASVSTTSDRELVQRPQEVTEQPPINTLPQEIFLHIFGYLSPEDLCRSSCVCTEWRRIASDNALWNTLDLEKVFQSLKVIDEKVWKEYVDLKALGLSVDDAPPLDNRSKIPAIKRLLATLQVEGNAGVTYLTLPKGLTLNKLWKLAGSPKKGNPTAFKYIWNSATQVLGDISVSKTYRVIITNSILKGSRNLPVADQQKLVNKIGCEMPGVLPVATLAILTYISSTELPLTCLYGDSPWTYTRCIPKVEGSHLIVGGFSPAGLYVDDGIFISDNFGVGALQKF